MPQRFRIILKPWLIILLLSTAYQVTAQEMWGITTSNFAGSTGALLNPSSIIASKLYMDVNIITADIFADNNYMYIHASDYSFFKLARKNAVFPKYGPDEMAFDRYAKEDNKNAYVQLLVKGPSFMLARGKHAFAVHTGIRQLTSLHQVPYDVANFGYFGLDYAEQHNINYFDKNFSATELVMAEAGISYAYNFRRYGTSDWSAGLTFKYLFSPGGGYAYIEDLDYIMVNDSTANIKNLRAEGGVCIPVDYDNNDFPDSGPRIKGTGFGFDIGITYEQKVISYQKKRFRSLCSQAYVDYLYKIGFSLLDIGSVKYTDNAQLHKYTDVNKYWVNIDTLSYYNMNELFRTLSRNFYGDPDQSHVADQFSVFLPAAASLQVDYKVYQNWYFGGVFIYPLPISKSMVYRPAQIALVPRYETPALEFAFPVSLYNWKYPRIGASVRYHIFTIGTDRLGAFLGLSDFTGLDLYFAIKVNFSKGHCWKGRRLVQCRNGEYGPKKQ